MKKTSCLASLFAFFILFCLLTACGGGSSASQNNSAAPAAPPAAAEAAPDSGSGYMSETSDYNSQTSNALPADRKIIRNAWLDLEAKNSAQLYETLSAYCTELGGYEFSYEISNYTEYSVISAVLKIPPEQLSAFMKFAGESGTLINSRMSSEDITENYYDAQIHLETKRKSLDKYYDLLDRANSVEEIIQLQRTIDAITAEIESIEGKLKLWNSQVDMATVELYIRQETDPIKIKKEINWNTLSAGDMGYLIKSGLVSVLNGIVSVLQWICVALLVISPLIIIAAIIFFVIFFIVRKKRKGKINKNDVSSKEDDNLNN